MDMLYRGVKGPITISDSGKGTKTTIEQKGFADSCVWSPYGNEDMVSALLWLQCSYVTHAACLSAVEYTVAL